MPPVGVALIANAMLSAGQFDEADALLQQAYSRWPAHPALWTIRYRLLLFSGRPQAAVAFVLDPDTKPTGVEGDELARLRRLAEAVDTRDPSALQASADEHRRRAESDVRNIPNSATIFALLGQPGLTFAAWDRYFLNRGSLGSSAPISRISRRFARELFAPPMAPLRSDSRFSRLITEIGLEDYWRQTGTRPDYRRTG
jgi:hypothetical protein